MILMRLALLFILLPLVELILLIEVGQRIGSLPTVLIVVGTGALGAYAAKSQGFATLRRVQRQMADGEIPAEGVVDALLIFLGGILLLAPGLLTDAAGLLCILPASRAGIKRWLRRRLEHWIQAGTFRIYMR